MSKISEPNSDHKLTLNYLKLLRLDEKAPSLDYLTTLVQAQLRTVPYENISKLLRLAENKRNLPTFEEYIANLDEFKYGGTCYTQNAYFGQLLQNLGFNSELVSTGTNDDFPAHAACRVKIGSNKYIVDLGLFSTFAGPFALSAGKRIRETHGKLDYLFEANTDEQTYQIQIFNSGQLEREHKSHPQKRSLDFFNSAVHSSFEKNEIFMSTIATHLVLPAGPVVFWGKVMYVATNGAPLRFEFKNSDEVSQAFEKYFGLAKYPIKKAIEILREMNGVDLFEDDGQSRNRD